MHIFRVQNFSTDISSLLSAIAPGVLPWQRTIPILLTVAGIAFWGLCAFGAMKLPGHRALQAAVAFYVLQVLVWPFPLGFRGLLPLLPLLVLWAKRGGEALPHRALAILRRTAVVAVALCILSNLAGAADHAHLRDNSTEKAETEALSKWIAATIPKNARLASDVSHPLLHIYAATRVPFVIVDGLASATRLQCDYVIMSGGFSTKRPAGGKNAPQLEVVWESEHGRFQVLRVTYGESK